MCVYTHTHTLEYDSAIKKKGWDLAICDNIESIRKYYAKWTKTEKDIMLSRKYYAKWNKSDRKKQIPYDFTYMWNLKKNQNRWIIKQQKQTYKYREQTDY